MILPEIAGTRHFEPYKDCLPFVIGTLDPARGVTHVMDDVTLDVVLETVDTVADLAAYLEEKEALLQSGRLGMAAGEEELLALYLRNADAAGRHTFGLEPDVSSVVLDEGLWESFSSSADRRAQVRANEVSYAWDRLIDTFAAHLLEGTAEYTTGHSVQEMEKALRFMASENRTERRMLSKALLDALNEGLKAPRFARVVDRTADRNDGLHYVFMTLDPRGSASYESYRRVRREMLTAYCIVTRWRRESARHVVGVATEPPRGTGSSEDLVYFDGTHWTTELAEEAERLSSDLQMLQNAVERRSTVFEYPLQGWKPKGRDRNSRCRCGSGKKIKQCCGA